MTKQAFAVLISVALLTGSPEAYAAESPTVLQPASPWNLDYSEDSCALRRSFGQGEWETLLEMRQFAPGEGLSFTILTKTYKPGLMARYFVSIDPEPEPTFQGNGRTVDAKDGFGGVVFTRMLLRKPERDVADGPSTPTLAEIEAREKTVTGITLSKGFDRPFTLQTGAMRKPMDAMRSCMTELLAHWGLDAATQLSLTRKAEPLHSDTISRWLNYPYKMALKERSGVVRARIMVDAEGKPTSCHIQVPAEDPAFEQSACAEIMLHGRFRPALDAHARPVPSYYVTSIFFVLT